MGDQALNNIWAFGGHSRSKLAGEELIVLPGIEGKVFSLHFLRCLGFLRVLQSSPFQMLMVPLATALC